MPRLDPQPDSLRPTYPSEAMQRVAERIERFAPTPVPILIQGETGTGKDVCAHRIWARSGSDKPFVALNVAAMPDSLVDSELFGHVKGAFTSADKKRRGLLARANGGILFLDEIAEMSPATQVKLLRAIEHGEFRPVGGDEDHRSEFRVIAASSASLEALVRQRRFREDLLHRLGAVRIRMPALRERLEDLPILVKEFLTGYRQRNQGRGPESASPEALRLLRRSRWPGNVRQLRNVVEAAAATADPDPTIEADHLLEFLPTGEPELARLNGLPTLEEAVRLAEVRVIHEALRRSEGHRARAAEMLGISEATLYRRMAELRQDGRLPAGPWLGGTGHDEDPEE